MAKSRARVFRSGWYVGVVLLALAAAGSGACGPGGGKAGENEYLTQDASFEDANPGDTGSGDTGPGDTGTPDTGPADTGTGDTGPADADLVDASDADLIDASDADLDAGDAAIVDASDADLDAGPVDPIECVDTIGDWEATCGPEDAFEGPPDVDIVSGTVEEGDLNSIRIVIVLDGDAETYWFDTSDAPSIYFVMQLEGTRYVECDVSADGSCDAGSSWEGASGSGQWIDSSTYEWTFVGFSISEIVSVSFNVLSFATPVYCDNCRWPAE